jgi:ABC-2 type transport system ATP-binding protein
MVEAKNLVKQFPGVVAVRDLSLTVRQGEIFGLVGPDGAGKTTVIRLLAGVMPPDSGTATIDGVDVVEDPEKAKEHLSYMPQRFGLYEDLTVDENVRFYADIFEVPMALRVKRIGPLLTSFGMEPFRKRLAGQLSGGMKQKLGLICALIHTPKILLLDEPTTGVDPVSRRDFWKILYGLREEGVTILISTAYLEEAERCTRLALFHQGAMAYCDTPSRLKAKMPGKLLNIASPQAREVQKRIQSLEGISGALLMGDHVHVAVDDDARRIPEITRALEEARLPFEPLTVTEPTMEDLFLGLLKIKEPTT